MIATSENYLIKKYLVLHIKIIRKPRDFQTIQLTQVDDLGQNQNLSISFSI